MQCACSVDVSGGPIGDGCAQRCIVGSEFPADSEKEGRLFCDVCRRVNVENLTRYLQPLSLAYVADQGMTPLYQAGCGIFYCLCPAATRPCDPCKDLA